MPEREDRQAITDHDHTDDYFQFVHNQTQQVSPLPAPPPPLPLEKKPVATNIALSPIPPSTSAPLELSSQPTAKVIKNENLAETYMLWSILNFCCCCWILGCIAIFMSWMAREENRNGNHEAARGNSRAAFWLNLIGTIFGIAIITVVCLLTLKHYDYY